jgi:nucleotidyltransferase/DNA polymerase involved in DNA repair
MPSTLAMRKCAELVFVPPRFDVYRAVSRQIQAIFMDYTPLVEPLSLDEAYLDVTDNLRSGVSAWATAKEIRKRIHDETELTASAGIPITSSSPSLHRTSKSQTANLPSCQTKGKPSWRAYQLRNFMASDP